MRIQFGLCTISNKPMDVLDVVDAAADAGYDGIELWGRDHVGDGTPADCAVIRDRVTDRGLTVPVYGSYLRPGTDGFADRMDHELGVAREVDADLIRVWAGEQEWQERDNGHLDAVVADLQTAAEAAASQGIELTVEKHEGTLTNTTEGARRVVERVDHPVCGLNYQPLFGLSTMAISEEARTLAPLSNNIHLQAVPERGSRNRCLLSEAFYDVEAVIRAFIVAGFDGFANVEFVTSSLPYEQAIVQDRAYLASLV